jgi:hypothetical protein
MHIRLFSPFCAAHQYSNRVEQIRGVDLAQVENMALYDAAARNALILDHAPIIVCLAILLSLALPQKHDPTHLVGEIRRRE